LRPVVLVLSNLKMFSWDNDGWHGFVEYHDFIGDEVDLELEIDHSRYNNTFAINGKFQPYIDIAVNEWVWLRLVNAGASLIVPLKFNSTHCQHYAIGVDGVFMEEPVELNSYYIFPGSRLDVAVKCSEFGNHSVQFWKDPDNIWIYQQVDSGENVILFTLEADRLHDGESLDISIYEAPLKPAYLDDLRDYPTEDIAGRYQIRSVFVSEDDDWFGFNDDVRWDGSGNSTLFSMEVGKVYEITFTTEMAVHPIHIHINHMQIVNDTQVEWSVFNTHAMHQIGTWRDTIYSVFERNVTVRVRPDKFTGYALVHCHYVIHADRGMMAEIEILPGELEDQNDEEDNI
jgi:FtsP/CotA-like multicopper oxidase with cupredoxin domain